MHEFPQKSFTMNKRCAAEGAQRVDMTEQGNGVKSVDTDLPAGTLRLLLKVSKTRPQEPETSYHLL